MTLDTTVGGVNSDSYLEVSDADTYFASRGNDAWSDGSDEEKEQALRRATVYIDGRFRGKWKGTKTTVDTTGGGSPTEQALAWPRTGVVDEEGSCIPDSVIPRVVKYATAEAAVRELVSPGSLQPDLDRTTRAERVGPISVEYFPGGDARTDLTIITDLLSGLLIGGGNSTVTFFSRA